MTRVKYPTKKEIHNQVREIIECSEIFDEITSEDCAECERVKNRSSVWKSTMYCVSGFAAVVVMVVVAESLIGGNADNSHAYGPSVGVTGETYDNENNVNIADSNIYNDNIGNDYTFSDYYNENIVGDNYESANSGSIKIESVLYKNITGTYKNDKISINRSYQIPNVSKEGKKFTEISDAYTVYTNSIDKYLQDKYYAKGSVYDKYVKVDVKANFTVSYNSSYYSGVQNVISFTNKYEEVADSSDTTIEKKLDVYYSNYDVDTGQRISLSDVYMSSDLYSRIAGTIKQEINELVKGEVFTLQNISDKYASEAKIAETVKNDDNWYISPTGSLVIQCNNFRTATDLDGIECSRPESFVIDKSVLSQLDKNSKYIMH